MKAAAKPQSKAAAAAVTPTALTPRQVQLVFGEIGELANRLTREFYFAPQEDDTPEQTDLLLQRLREAVGRIGWLADLGAGFWQSKEYPREWLLPPVFFSEAEGNAS